MKYSTAQLITKYTTIVENTLCYQGVPVDKIPLENWELMLKEESDKEKKTFFEEMIARNKKHA